MLLGDLRDPIGRRPRHGDGCLVIGEEFVSACVRPRTDDRTERAELGVPSDAGRFEAKMANMAIAAVNTKSVSHAHERGQKGDDAQCLWEDEDLGVVPLLGLLDEPLHLGERRREIVSVCAGLGDGDDELDHLERRDASSGSQLIVEPEGQGPARVGRTVSAKLGVRGWALSVERGKGPKLQERAGKLLDWSYVG